MAEDEAAAAAADRDIATDCTRTALKHAAAARAEAALGDLNANTPKDDEDIDDLKYHTSDRVNPNHDLHHAMLLHEVAAIINLHHHAPSVQNIRNLVHVILDLTDDNYKALQALARPTPRRRQVLPGGSHPLGQPGAQLFELALHGLRHQVVDRQHHLH
jgi:hypothetical protein